MVVWLPNVFKLLLSPFLFKTYRFPTQRFPSILFSRKTIKYQNPGYKEFWSGCLISQSKQHNFCVLTLGPDCSSRLFYIICSLTTTITCLYGEEPQNVAKVFFPKGLYISVPIIPCLPVSHGPRFLNFISNKTITFSDKLKPEFTNSGRG